MRCRKWSSIEGVIEGVNEWEVPGLHHVRRQMKITADKVHTQLNSILNSSRTMLQDAVITMRDGRYCLPVRAENKSQFAGMVQDQSAT